MFLSTSAFGVVASSSRQVVIIDQGRTSTVEVNDNDDHFSCNQFLQGYSDQPLDLFRKQNEHQAIKQNGLLPEETALRGCESNPNNFASKTKNSSTHATFDMSEIRITNVRSLAPNHLTEETQYETSREEINEIIETNPEKCDGSDIDQNRRTIYMPGEQLNLNTGRRKGRKCPNPAIIRASPTSIHGLRKIRARSSHFDQTLGNSKEISRKNRAPYNFSLNKHYPMSIKQSRISNQMSRRNNGEVSRKHDIQTNAAQNYSEQRNPVFILSLPHQRVNSVITGSSDMSSSESANHQRLQISPALESGLDIQTLRQNGAPNSSPPNYPYAIFPTTTLNADFSSKPLRQDQNQTDSTCLRTTPQSSTAKNGGIRPLPDELLADLEVVRIHRRPQFRYQESRELVEVRPRGLSDDAPTLLAYRELSGRILVDWTANSNYPAAEKIKKMMQLNLQRNISHQERELGYAHKEASTTTAQCPREVTMLVANGAVYTVSDQ